jgi:predicted Zn-dependent protease
MKLSVPVFLALVLLSVACVTTGPGGKTSLVLISSGQEVAIGAGMAEEIARTEKNLPDSAWQEYLSEVGQRIVAVCDRKDIEYSFTVIESEQINAFAAPGGFIYFYTGLLREMDSEAEMAAVMAHEVSHVVARHGAKRLQAALGVSLAYQLATGNESSEVLDAAVAIGMGLLFAGYSRDNEHEADGFGLTYLVRAGYDPHGMEAMLEKLATLGSKSSNVFERLTSSHPETQERIRNTKARIAGLPSLPPDLILGKDRYRAMLNRFPPQSSSAGSGS